MSKSLRASVFAAVVVIALAWPSVAGAQTVTKKKHDSIWNGLLFDFRIAVRIPSVKR